MFLTLLFLSLPAMSQTGVIASIEHGNIEGVIDQQGISAFLGIPFAASTAGDNRWRPPQPVTPWQGVRATRDFGPACMQSAPQDYGPWNAPYDIPGQTSEDCLSLNVWTPDSRAEKLPVLVWIHGGGFVSGASSVRLYDGSSMASHGVVVVSINYRLGVFGFMSHPQLAEEGPYNGEYGLLDQVAALKWIQRNITAFGGDPGNVTIAGQSAGGASVMYLLSTTLTEGLFHKAIIQSGGGTRGFVPAVDEATALSQGIAVQQALGSRSLTQMRQVDADMLFTKARTVRFLPFLGNHFKTTILHRSIPLIAGITRDEVSASQPLQPVSQTQFNAYLENQFGDFAPRLAPFYRNDSENYLPALRQVRRDTIFSSLTEMLCRPRCPDTLFLYEFVQEPPGQPDGYGSFHSSELAYVFGTLTKDSRPYQQEDYTLSRRMQDAWLAFLHASPPTEASLAWPVYTSQHDIMRFGGEKPSKIRRIMTKEKEAVYQQLMAENGPVSVINLQ